MERPEGVDKPDTGTLYLIPTPLGDGPLEQVLPEHTRQIAAGLTTFIVERAKTARAVLKRLGTQLPLQRLTLLELNEHTPAQRLADLLQPLLDGQDVGLLSEAGCPAVADPGAELVRLAHRHGIRVRPLVGPSAILLALMALGLTAQRFAFHGYLPAKTAERLVALRRLEQRAEQEDAVQLFIDTPYRSRTMYTAALEACRADTWFGLACDLTLASEFIASRTVGEWRAKPVPIDNRPCVFALWRGAHDPRTT